MQLRTEIEIERPPADVWRILADTDSYPEWNPFIVRFEGQLAVGSKLRVTISPPGESEMSVSPTVLRFEPGRELRWRGKLLFDFLFRGEHFFELRETRQGQTRLIHGEDFSGILVRFSGRILTATARGFVLMNQALKRRAEGEKSPS